LQDPSSPVTSLTWIRTNQDSAKYILASAQAGALNLHHCATQKLLERAFLPQNSTMECATSKENLLTVSACPSESQLLAAGGAEGSVVLYHNTGSSLQHSGTLSVPLLQSGGGAARAHSSRVLALEWHPQESNLLFSGGWDLTVKVLLLSKLHVIKRAQHLCFPRQVNC
jgi:WD40 repeat protein